MDILAERREEIVDDAAAAGFDLGGDGHAGGDRLGVAIDQERCPVERDMRDIGRRGIALPSAGFAPRGVLVAEADIAVLHHRLDQNRGAALM